MQNDWIMFLFNFKNNSELIGYFFNCIILKLATVAFLTTMLVI